MSENDEKLFYLRRHSHKPKTKKIFFIADSETCRVFCVFELKIDRYGFFGAGTDNQYLQNYWLIISARLIY